jgi:predicted transcriptional regulator
MDIQKILIILKSCKTPSSHSDIFHLRGYSWDTIRKYFGYMHSAKLISAVADKSDGRTRKYKTTRKGMNFIAIYGVQKWNMKKSKKVNLSKSGK